MAVRACVPVDRDGALAWKEWGCVRGVDGAMLLWARGGIMVKAGAEEEACGEDVLRREGRGFEAWRTTFLHLVSAQHSDNFLLAVDVCA